MSRITELVQQPTLTTDEQREALRLIRSELLAEYRIVKALMPLPPRKRLAILRCFQELYAD